MAFDDLPPLAQIPGLGQLRPDAPAYTAMALEKSRAVAERSRTALDVPYGPDYWQKVDFYLPDDTALRRLPIFLMLHGGGFIRGYKEWVGFQAPTITSLPAIYVAVSYRLAPAAKVPTIVEDCYNAVKLVYDRVHRYGGDRNRIFIGGHSAGAILAAYLALRPDGATAHGMPADVIKGCFPVAGVYNLDPAWIPPDTVLATVFPQLFERAADGPAFSPITHTAGNTTPFFVSWGDRDTPYVIESSEAFVKALAAASGPVERHVWPGFGHFEAHSALEHIEDPWVQTLRRWMAGPPQSR